MSIELEKALNDLQAEGGWIVVKGGKIVRFGRDGFKVSAQLKKRLLKLGEELDSYVAQRSLSLRCFWCPKVEQCNDGTACQYPPA